MIIIFVLRTRQWLANVWHNLANCYQDGLSLGRKASLVGLGVLGEIAIVLILPLFLIVFVLFFSVILETLTGRASFNWIASTVLGIGPAYYLSARVGGNPNTASASISDNQTGTDA